MPVLEKPKDSDSSEIFQIQKEAENDFRYYVKLVDPRYFMGAMHQHLCKKLQAVADGKIKRLIINTPPRNGKSRLCAIEYPGWLLGKYPGKEIVAASYSSNLSKKHSSSCMDRVKSFRYKMIFPETKLKFGSQKKDDWKTIGGGGYMSTGVDGSLTGMGADLLIIDDPVKDHAQAHSKTYREKVWNWYLSTAYTRLSPGAAIIIIMTRWHVDDLVGRLLDPERQEEIEESGGGGGNQEKEDWQVVNLPAIAEENDEIGRKEGEALFPEWYPLPRLNKIRSIVGPHIWSALYRQKPVLKGGNYADVGKLNRISQSKLPPGLTWVRYWDLAATEKETSDFTASVKGAIDSNGNLYLMDMIKRRLLWPKARALIVAVAKLEKLRVGVEAVGGFKTAFSNLKEFMPSTIPLKDYGADTDKVVRAFPWLAMVDNGKVFLVEGAWNKDFIDELVAFPASDHDDQIDAVSGVLIMLTAGGEGIMMQKLRG